MWLGPFALVITVVFVGTLVGCLDQDEFPPTEIPAQIPPTSDDPFTAELGATEFSSEVPPAVGREALALN